MPNRPSEPQIDIVAQAVEEQGRRLIAASDIDTVEIDKLGDTVRIQRGPRAETTRREMLRQPWLSE